MKFGLISLLVLSLNYANAVDPYLKGVKRSELFELTDFKVPKFDITITDEEFAALKQSVNTNSNSNIDDTDPCAAVKATRKLLENIGVDIEEMGRHPNSPDSPATASSKEHIDVSPKDDGAQDPMTSIIKMLQDNKIVSEAMATFKKMMDKGKFDPSRVISFMKMMQNGRIDPEVIADDMKKQNVPPKVIELVKKIIEYGNEKREQHHQQVTSFIKMFQDSKIVADTMTKLKKFMEKNKIDPSGITNAMKILQNGGVDPKDAEAFLQKMKLHPKVSEFIMKIVNTLHATTGGSKEDKADAILKMLKDNNVDAETMATFKAMMEDGRIDINNASTILKMTQSGAVNPDVILSYMGNLGIEPEVVEIFKKVMSSGGKKETAANKEEQTTSLLKALKEMNMDDETVATFKRLIEEGKVDPSGTLSFVKMLQSGSVDPESAAAYMKNLNLDPEVNEIFLKLMNNNAKPKEYEERPSIYEVYGKLVFTLDDDHVQSFDKVKFGISGASSLFNYKSSFKINIKEKKELYGVKNLKLRADITDGSMLTTKLITDLRLKNNMIVPQSNFAELYINGKYMGLYVMTESLKKQWAMKKFGVEEVNNLYKCDNGKLTYIDSYNGCTNDNDKADKLEWEKFLKTLDAAKTEKDIEGIFNVESYLQNAAFDYLNGSIDHYTAGAYHNFYMFKSSETAKWEYIPYDFDSDLYAFNYEDKTLTCNTGIDYTKYFEKNAKLNQLLIYSNPERFEKMVKQLIETLWNPTDLFERIDQLKKFLTPYMKKDRAFGENGHVASFLNENARYVNHENTFEEWSNYVEYTSSTTFGCGLKRWIVEKFKYVCDHHSLQCDADQVAFVKSIDYDATFIDQVSSENEKVDERMSSGTGNGNAGIGDSQASLNMEEQYNIFKRCDSVDIFYVMANYYGWDYSKMIIDPETGLAIPPTSDKINNNSTSEAKAKAKPASKKVQRNLNDIEN